MIHRQSIKHSYKGLFAQQSTIADGMNVFVVKKVLLNYFATIALPATLPFRLQAKHKFSSSTILSPSQQNTFIPSSLVVKASIITIMNLLSEFSVRQQKLDTVF
uniref:Uncharacterized protein n=1 Tax=Glossina austeni TaxID=7395 RepID=A0A1A9UJ60_GLOAU